MTTPSYSQPSRTNDTMGVDLSGGNDSGAEEFPATSRWFRSSFGQALHHYHSLSGQVRDRETEQGYESDPAADNGEPDTPKLDIAAFAKENAGLGQYQPVEQQPFARSPSREMPGISPGDPRILDQRMAERYQAMNVAKAQGTAHGKALGAALWPPTASGFDKDALGTHAQARSPQAPIGLNAGRLSGGSGVNTHLGMSQSDAEAQQ